MGSKRAAPSSGGAEEGGGGRGGKRARVRTPFQSFLEGVGSAPEQWAPVLAMWVGQYAHGLGCAAVQDAPAVHVLRLLAGTISKLAHGGGGVTGGTAGGSTGAMGLGSTVEAARAAAAAAAAATPAPHRGSHSGGAVPPADTTGNTASALPAGTTAGPPISQLGAAWLLRAVGELARAWRVVAAQPVSSTSGSTIGSADTEPSASPSATASAVTGALWRQLCDALCMLAWRADLSQGLGFEVASALAAVIGGGLSQPSMPAHHLLACPLVAGSCAEAAVQSGLVAAVLQPCSRTPAASSSSVTAGAAVTQASRASQHDAATWRLLLGQCVAQAREPLRTATVLERRSGEGSTPSLNMQALATAVLLTCQATKAVLGLSQPDCASGSSALMGCTDARASAVTDPVSGAMSPPWVTASLYDWDPDAVTLSAAAGHTFWGGRAVPGDAGVSGGTDSVTAEPAPSQLLPLPTWCGRDEDITPLQAQLSLLIRGQERGRRMAAAAAAAVAAGASSPCTSAVVASQQRVAVTAPAIPTITAGAPSAATPAPATAGGAAAVTGAAPNDPDPYELMVDVLTAAVTAVASQHQVVVCEAEAGDPAPLASLLGCAVLAADVGAAAAHALVLDAGMASLSAPVTAAGHAVTSPPAVTPGAAAVTDAAPVTAARLTAGWWALYQLLVGGTSGTAGAGSSGLGATAVQAAVAGGARSGRAPVTPVLPSQQLYMDVDGGGTGGTSGGTVALHAVQQSNSLPELLGRVIRTVTAALCDRATSATTAQQAVVAVGDVAALTPLLTTLTAACRKLASAACALTSCVAVPSNLGSASAGPSLPSACSCVCMVTFVGLLVGAQSLGILY